MTEFISLWQIATTTANSSAAMWVQESAIPVMQEQCAAHLPVESVLACKQGKQAWVGVAVLAQAAGALVSVSHN